MAKIQPVIMAGGRGTRLWPLSRAAKPKQFLPLASQRPMIADAVSRAQVHGAQAPIIVTGKDLGHAARMALKDAGLPFDTIVLEPVGRSTAPVAAIAALMAAAHGGDTIVVLLAADHAIPDQRTFSAALDKAIAAAGKGDLAIFGVKPKSAATRFGYVECGEKISEGVFRVTRFVEKPDAAEAEKFVASKNYLWNSGNFVFRADRMIEELEKRAPDILTSCRLALSDAKNVDGFLSLNDSFRDCRSISLDYAVMEKTNRAVVVTLDGAWSDIGAWGALWELETKDAHGNVLHGDVVLKDSRGLYVRADGTKVGVVGLSDLVIVAQKDALLVAHRNRDAEIGKLGEQIPLEPTPTERPWGSYRVLDAGPGYQVKYLEVRPDEAFSLQYHLKRAEHWVVVKGRPTITVGDTTREYEVNETVFVPVGTKHRIANSGKEPCAIIEVQVGSYLGEDDIVRLEDKYNRL